MLALALPLLSLALTLTSVGSAAPCQDAKADQGEAEVTRQVATMGTTLDLTVVARNRSTALAASEAAVRAVEAVEARLSTWRVDSELSRLNHTAVNTPFQPSPDLARDLGRALRWHRETQGAFQPNVAALVEVWGLRRGGRRPTDEELAAALASSTSAGFTYQLPEQVVRRSPGSGIEEGGFGKGVALDAAGHALLATDATRAFLDFGGQTLVVGDQQQSPVSVALADPRERTRGVLTLELHAGSAATSGNSERGIVVEGERLGHILDPRSGRPAPDFGSLVVWADQAVDADCLSTGLYVLGPDAALAFASARPSLEVIVIETLGEGLRVRATAGLRTRLSPSLPEITVESYSPTEKDSP